MNPTKRKTNINIEFPKVQLLGYYEEPYNTLSIEYKNPIEAGTLCQLFNESLKSIKFSKTIDLSFRRKLLNSELIFKSIRGELLAFYPSEQRVKISDVIFDKKKIRKLSKELQSYFTPGNPIIHSDEEISKKESKHELTKVKVPIIDIVNINGYDYYELSYADSTCYVKLLPFEIQNIIKIKQKKNLDCVFLGFDQQGNPKLMQDRESYIEDLYEANTVHKFTYISTCYEQHGDLIKEFHWVSDSYGLKHRLYAELSEEQKKFNTQLCLYIKRIDPHTKKLSLSMYNPRMDPFLKEWYKAERIFSEINETNNKELFFDAILNKDYKKCSRLEQSMIGQYNGHSNLWLFTYLNILDTEIVTKYFRKHQIEELATVSQIMIKLQKWIVEESSFLDLFSEDTKNDTIEKSTYQIEKYQRILIAIDIIRKGEQYSYIKNIVSLIMTSGRITLKRDERIEVLSYILRLYPEYITEDLEATCNLIKAMLNLKDGDSRIVIDNIVYLLNFYIESNTHKIRKSIIRTNDIDTSQTFYFNEILSLLGCKILIYSSNTFYNEIICREAKARFFRYLSFVCNPSMQSTLLKAAINSLVGILTDKDIFTWKNIVNINIIELTNLASKATVLDCNLENDFYYNSGKSGVLVLDPTGFTIVPYKQCITTLIPRCTSLEEINVIHNLDLLPLKLGSMYNFRNIDPNDNPVEQHLLWEAITKVPSNLQKAQRPEPRIADIVKVMVKEQNQSDKLKSMVFVTTIDNRYQSVDGVIMVNEISGKWIEDARTVFNPGDVFYAKVIRDNGKYNFSIKDEVNKFSTVTSSAEEDAQKIIINKTEESNNQELPNGFVQELILLLDMYIRMGNDMQNKLTMTGYAYCLSSLLGDPKSYYYEFMLRYFAIIERFMSGNYQDLSISKPNLNDKYFKNLSGKKHIVELLAITEKSTEEAIDSLSKLAKQESTNDVGKVSSMLLAFLYANQANLSFEALNAIKKEIKTFITNDKDLDLTTLDLSNEEIQEEISFEGKQSEEEVCNDNKSPEEKDLNGDEMAITENRGKMEQTYTFVPLKLNIFEDCSTIIDNTTKKVDREESIMEISIKEYAADGFLIIVNNQGCIGKIPVSYIRQLEHGVRIDNCINPYKLSNYFVVPSDCAIGLLVTTNDDKYIKIWNTKDITSSQLSNIKFNDSQTDIGHRFQAFILPPNIGIDEYYNNCTKVNLLSKNIQELFESYGVLI